MIKIGFIIKTLSASPDPKSLPRQVIIHLHQEILIKLVGIGLKKKSKHLKTISEGRQIEKNELVIRILIR